MGWGVVEDGRAEFPPGTVLLEEKQDEEQIVTGDDGLKRKGNIVLQPQPEDDPNDPLLWSRTWKLAHLFIICIGSAATNALSTMVIPGLGVLTEKFGVSDGDVSTFIVTAPTFYTSVAAFLVVSGAEIWGRRPFYIISFVVLALGNLLGFLAQTYPALVAARVVTGVFTAPLLQLITASIADIFFVHQRGMAVSFWNLSITAGGQTGQVVAGYITDSMGISAVFGFAAVVFAVLTVPAYFVVLESSYFKRGQASQDPRPTTSDGDDIDAIKAAVHTPSKKGYRQQLSIWPGRLTDKKFLSGVFKPMLLLSFPATVYTTFTNTLFLILVSAVTTLMSIILAAPPYNLSATQIGLTSLPAFGAALVSGPMWGWMSDASVRFMARHNGKNRGVAEPEFRLILFVLAMPIIAVGLVALGTAIDQGLPLSWVLIWLGVISLGSTGGLQISISYLIDCMPEHTAQAFTSVNMIASLVVFAGTGPFVGWLEGSGALVVFGSLGAASVSAVVFGIPLYIFGKRIRSWYGRAEWAQKILR